MARQYARRLHQAREVGLKRIDKRTPGGRFNARAHMRAHAQRTTRRAGHRPPVGDHQGHHRAAAGAPRRPGDRHLAARWAHTNMRSGRSPGCSAPGSESSAGGARSRCSATAPNCSPTAAEPLRLVPGIQTGGGTAFGGDAISLCAEHLEIDNPRRPRFLYVRQRRRLGMTPSGRGQDPRAARRWRTRVHISIGMPPLSVEADR